MVRLEGENLERFMSGAFRSSEVELATQKTEMDMGILSPNSGGRVLRAITACRLGASPESVSRFLDWREFERFCADLLLAKGFTVTENITLTRPRMQIDILARSPSFALVIDCKHWARGKGRSALLSAAEAQVLRAKRLRRTMENLEPLAVVVLVLSDEEARFAEGSAVVPVRTLGSFVDSIESFSELLVFH